MVDLRKCVKGDILISKHGLRLTYSNPLPVTEYYDHRVIYPSGAPGERTHSGYTYRHNRQPEDHDIVKVISRKQAL